MSIDKDYLDSEGAIARIGGNAAIYTRLLKLFLAEDHLGQLDDAASSGNDTAILQTAHALKGVCANLSLNKLKEIALEIETCIKEQRDYKDALAEFAIAYQKSIGFVKEYLEK